MSIGLASLACLGVGALLNIGVAWALAAFVGVPSRQAQLAPGARPIAWPRTVPADWPEANAVHTRRWWCCTTINAVGYTRIPEESEPDFVSRASGENACTLMIRQWGWPMRSLEYQWTHTQPMLVSVWLFKPPTGVSPRTGLPVPPGITGSPQRTHLPLMPVWPGFLVNSLIYGATAGAAIFGPGALRRARRRRRGLCPGCGYDARGIEPCPECGASGLRPPEPVGSTVR